MNKLLLSIFFLIIIFSFKQNNFSFETSNKKSFLDKEDSTVIYLRFPDLHRNYLKVFGNDSIYYTELDKDSLNYTEIKGRLVSINDSIYYVKIYETKSMYMCKPLSHNSDSIIISNEILKVGHQIAFIFPGNLSDKKTITNMNHNSYYSKHRLKIKANSDFLVNTGYLNSITSDTIIVKTNKSSDMIFSMDTTSECGFYLVFAKNEVYSMSKRACYRFSFTAYKKSERKGPYYIMK